MTHGIHAPGRRRAPSRGPERLRGVWAGVIAILAVLAGILLVNLLNGAPDPKHPSAPVAAPIRTPDGAVLGSTRSATPSASASAAPRPSPSSPSPSPTRPAEKPPSSAAPPAAEPRPPVPAVPVVVLNDSRIQGLAESTARQLTAAGFTVARTGPYRSTYNVPVPTVFYDDAHRDAAQALMDAVPGIKKITPRSQTRIVTNDPLILVVTRDFPADPGN